MVGILLALQIDSWNHQTKTRKELAKIFAEIHEDLARDTTSISDILNERNLDIQAQFQSLGIWCIRNSSQNNVNSTLNS